MTIRVSHVMWLNEWPGHSAFGGMENHLFVLLPALRARGVDVELIVPTFHLGPEMIRRLRALQRQGIHITLVAYPHHPKQPRWQDPQTIAFVRRLCTVLQQRCNRILHLHEDIIYATGALGLARCPYTLLSLHSDTPHWSTPLGKLYLRIVKNIFRHYIVISERVRTHYLSTSGTNPSRVTRIYYGLSLPPNTTERIIIRQTHHIPVDRFVVGVVGRLTQAKNIPLFIQALQCLPDVHGVIVGGGKLEEELHALAIAQGVSNVQFLGAQPDAWKIMPCFDLFCLPSLWEGLGLVLIEAMLQHVPIVGSRAGAIPEILGNGTYGMLFDSGDVEGLVQAIQTAKARPEEMRERAERAYTYALQTFTVDAMAEQTIQVYHHLLGTKT